MNPKKLKRNFLREFHHYAGKMIAADKALSAILFDENNPQWELVSDLCCGAEEEMENFLGKWLSEVTVHFIDTDHATLEELRVFFDETVNNYEPLNNTEYGWYVTHSDFCV